LLSSLPVHEAVRVIYSTGYRSAEVWASHFEKTLITESYTYRELTAAIKQVGCPITVHAPYKGYNIASSDPVEKQRSLAAVLRAVALASQLGANILTVHPGRPAHLKNSPRFWTEQAKAFRVIAEAALVVKVMIAIENLEDSDNISAADDLWKLSGMLEIENIGTTLDIAHFVVAHPSEEWHFAKFPNVLNVHLSDIIPGKTHAPLGQGNLRIAQALNKLLVAGYSGPLVIEGRAPGRELETVRANMEFLKRILFQEVPTLRTSE
jgi:sugar phosphate isomerase/epimerase